MTFPQGTPNARMGFPECDAERLVRGCLMSVVDRLKARSTVPILDRSSCLSRIIMHPCSCSRRSVRSPTSPSLASRHPPHHCWLPHLPTAAPPAASSGNQQQPHHPLQIAAIAVVTKRRLAQQHE